MHEFAQINQHHVLNRLLLKSMTPAFHKDFDRRCLGRTPSHDLAYFVGIPRLGYDGGAEDGIYFGWLGKEVR